MLKLIIFYFFEQTFISIGNEGKRKFRIQDRFHMKPYQSNRTSHHSNHVDCEVSGEEGCIDLTYFQIMYTTISSPSPFSHFMCFLLSLFFLRQICKFFENWDSSWISPPPQKRKTYCAPGYLLGRVGDFHQNIKFEKVEQTIEQNE